MTRSGVELVHARDPDAAAAAAARVLAEAAANGEHIALSGGSTPRPAYERAAELERDWTRAHLWWGDERCVPADDERSNFRLARESLLDRLAAPPAAVHRIRGELGPQAAADDYERELAGATLGVVLLGLGSDGHTASLFPHAPALSELGRLAVAITDQPLARVSLTLLALRQAATIVFLVVGGDKAAAARRAFAGAADPATPASLVRAKGRTLAILDDAAAALLEAT